MIELSEANEDAAPRSLREAFDARVERSPEALFVETLGSEALTYEQVAERVDGLCATVRQAGNGRAHRVGLYLPNTAAWIVGSLAVWRLGGSVVACGTLLSPKEAKRAFELAGVELVITTAADAVAELGLPAHVVDEGGRELGAEGGAAGRCPCVAISPDDEAVVFFTSGTTGTPKGVCHKQADLIHWAEQVASAYASSPGFRLTTAPARVAPGVIFTPFGHIGGYLAMSFRVWIGRPLVLVPKFNVEAVVELLDRHEHETLQLTPTMVHMLANAKGETQAERLKYITSSTAPLPEATRLAFEKRYDVPILQAYGMTEVGTISQERYEDIAAGKRPGNSVGRLAKGVEVRIETEDGAEAPPGGEGEIVVRTATVAMDFMGADVPKPVDGWFHTGDIGRLDADGLLYVTGRKSDKLIVGGFNVYPAEVEEVLRRSEHVLDAAVVGVADERLGERPVAAVVWAGDPRPDEVREHARADLAHYKVPREWIEVDSIPLTSRGKVDRVRAREIVEEALI